MFSIIQGNIWNKFTPLTYLTVWQPLSRLGGDWTPNKCSAFSMLVLLVLPHSSAGSCLAGSFLDFLPVPAFSINVWLGQKSPSALTAMKWGSYRRCWKLEYPLLSLPVSKNSANNYSMTNLHLGLFRKIHMLIYRTGTICICVSKKCMCKHAATWSSAAKVEAWREKKEMF